MDAKHFAVIAIAAWTETIEELEPSGPIPVSMLVLGVADQSHVPFEQALKVWRGCCEAGLFAGSECAARGPLFSAAQTIARTLRASERSPLH